MRISPSSSARRGLAAAAVLALALTGCGGGGEEPSGDQSSSASASPSGSASPSEAASSSASASSGDSEAKQEYVEAVREAAGQGEISVRTRIKSMLDSPQGESVTTTVTGVSQVSDGQVSARFSTTLPEAQGGQKITSLIVDDTFYLQAPGIPKGKFQKIDIGQAGGSLGDQLQQQLDQLDPRKQGEATIEAISSVEKLGESTVNGTDVTDYRVTLDFAGYADSQGSPLLQQLVTSGQAPSTVTAVNSLDDEGRVRRSVTEIEVQGATVKSTADFLEYDVDVDITAPPENKIVESALGGGPAGGAGGAGNGGSGNGGNAGGSSEED